jgi:hypothetical protein
MSPSGTNAKCRHEPAMSAQGGIADVMCSLCPDSGRRITALQRTVEAGQKRSTLIEMKGN